MTNLTIQDLSVEFFFEELFDDFFEKEIELLDSGEDFIVFQVVHGSLASEVLSSKWLLFTFFLDLIPQHKELKVKFKSLLHGIDNMSWRSGLSFKSKKSERDAKLIIRELLENVGTLIEVITSMTSEEFFESMNEHSIQIETYETE